MYLHNLNFLATVLRKFWPQRLICDEQANPYPPYPLTWFLNLNSLSFLRQRAVDQDFYPVTDMIVWTVDNDHIPRGHYHLQAESIGTTIIGATVDSEKLYNQICALDDNQPLIKRPYREDDISLHTQRLPCDTDLGSGLGVASTGHLNKLKSSQYRHTAWQIFTPQWIIGLLPCDDHRYHYVLSSSKVIEFPEDALSRLFKKFSIPLSAKPLSYFGPKQISSFHRKHYRYKQSLLLGDALHQVHPLAGQGLNLSLADIDVAIKKLSRHPQASYKDLSSALIKERYTKNALMHRFCQLAFWGKGHRFLGLGLNAFNQSTFLKYFLFEHYQQNQYQSLHKDFIL